MDSESVLVLTEDKPLSTPFMHLEYRIPVTQDKNQSASAEISQAKTIEPVYSKRSKVYVVQFLVWPYSSQWNIHVLGCWCTPD